MILLWTPNHAAVCNFSAETPQHQTDSILCIWSDTWFDMNVLHVSIFWVQNASRRLLFFISNSDLCCKSWTVRVVTGHGSRCYFRKSIHPAEGWKPNVSEARLWATGRAPLPSGSPGLLGNLRGKREVLSLRSPKLASVCSLSKNLKPRITVRDARRATNQRHTTVPWRSGMKIS